MGKRQFLNLEIRSFLLYLLQEGRKGNGHSDRHHDFLMQCTVKMEWMEGNDEPAMNIPCNNLDKLSIISQLREIVM